MWMGEHEEDNKEYEEDEDVEERDGGDEDEAAADEEEEEKEGHTAAPDDDDVDDDEEEDDNSARTRAGGTPTPPPSRMRCVNVAIHSSNRILISPLTSTAPATLSSDSQSAAEQPPANSANAKSAETAYRAVLEPPSLSSSPPHASPRSIAIGSFPLLSVRAAARRGRPPCDVSPFGRWGNETHAPARRRRGGTDPPFAVSAPDP